MLTIIITSLVTLAVTIAAGLVLDYIKHIKPKLVYKVVKAVPIKLEKKSIGANVVTLENPSSKTIKDIVLKIKTRADDIQSGGVAASGGLDYSVGSEKNCLTITLPFLKSREKLSITTISEGLYVPVSPDVTVRSPDLFKLIDADEIREAGVLKGVAPFAVLASLVVGGVLAFAADNVVYQSTDLVVAASAANLPLLAQEYAMHQDVYYYSAGPMAYSLARESPKREILKYKVFLEKVFQESDFMASSSRCSLYFYLAKISALLGNNVEAKQYFDKAQNESAKEFKKLERVEGEEVGAKIPRGEVGRS